jgi:hypothetical protein
MVISAGNPGCRPFPAGIKRNVIEDEATRGASKIGLPMFGDVFPW